MEILKGIYSLKEAGIFIYTALVKQLEPYGYYTARYTPGLWRHKTSNILFTLALDDFGIKFYNTYHADHLFKVLRAYMRSLLVGLVATTIGSLFNDNMTKDMWIYPCPDISKRHSNVFNIPNHPNHNMPRIIGQLLITAPSSLHTSNNRKKSTKRVQSINRTFLYYAKAP